MFVQYSFGGDEAYPIELPRYSYFLDKLKKRISAIRQKYTAFFINTLCSLSLSSLGFLDFWKIFLLARSDKAKRNPENTTTLDSLWENQNKCTNKYYNNETYALHFVGHRSHYFWRQCV